MEVANFEFSHYMRKPPKVVHIFSGGSDTITRKLASGLLHSIKDITRGIWQGWTETEQRAWSIKGRTTLTPNPINQLHHHQHHKNIRKPTQHLLELPGSTGSAGPCSFPLPPPYPRAHPTSESRNVWRRHERTVGKNSTRKRNPRPGCWTVGLPNKKNIRIQKSLRIIGPFLWVSSKKHAWNNHPVTNNTSAIPRNSLWQSVYR